MPEDQQAEVPNPDPKNGDVCIPEKELDTLTLPQSLRDFSSSVNQVLTIGREGDSSNESSSESVEIGRDRTIKYPSSHGSLDLSVAEDGSFTDQDNITENSTRSPLDIDGGFATELAFAFSIPSTLEYEFPSSPIHYSTSSSPASLFTSVRQARGINPINHTTPAQSIRASIIEALSMISVPERLSGSAIMFDRKSPKSAKSISSEKSSRFRFSRSSLSLDRRRRKSAASVVTRSSSKASLPSPDARDVAVLFSGSQESIQIGMPSAPPTSFSGAPPTFLGPYIPHSPIFLPATLVGALPNSLEPSVFEPIFASTPRRNRHATRVLPSPSRRHSSAVKSSLIFDQSLFLLPPASPSSDGLSHGGGLESASASMSSLGLVIPNRSDSSLPGREKTSPRIPKTPNNMERSPPRVLVQSTPSPSPEKSQRSVHASLSMKSLELKAAVDSLVAAQLSPPHSDDKQTDISTRSARNVEKGDTLDEGSDERTRVSSPTVSVADCDWSSASMDITLAHPTANLEIDEIDGLPNSKGISTLKSGHS
ncbi:hypothetical protein BS47DRAFT_23234 [Hydnum rufescens UP504]|uniref:Uncharacterized protein n=1 Tax=Hydnum rufescens UP504 TaxID=1448309 RepID=A0A9P6E1Y3_9AGAM|nr:hypothetical protein BS47DRAFT_23234 [Hydnum rufescens UP504]